MNLLYRTRQFWSALTAAPAAADLALAGRFLTPAQMQLFCRLQPGEQEHSLGIMRRLLSGGEADCDLIQAALLHDCGKNCHPLRIWERVAIVVVQAVWPQKAEAWGRGDPDGWKRAFVIAKNHPRWGAALAAQAGASSTVIELIERHQERLPRRPPADRMEALLTQLQRLDNGR